MWPKHQCSSIAEFQLLENALVRSGQEWLKPGYSDACLKTNVGWGGLSPTSFLLPTWLFPEPLPHPSRLHTCKVLRLARLQHYCGEKSSLCGNSLYSRCLQDQFLPWWLTHTNTHKVKTMPATLLRLLKIVLVKLHVSIIWPEYLKTWICPPPFCPLQKDLSFI